MRRIVRSILAVLAGFVAASAVMLAIEAINGRVLYPELGRWFWIPTIGAFLPST